MKIIFLTNLLFIIFLKSLFAQTWTALNPPVTAPNILNSISFKDGINGVCAGGDFYGTVSTNNQPTEVIVQTNDATNWYTDALPSNKMILQIQYINPEQIYSITQNYYDNPFITSDDNGNSFTLLNYAAGFTIRSKMFFVDSLTGFVAGAFNSPSEWGSILKTIDGGISWSSQLNQNTNRYEIIDIYFVDKLNGFALGMFGNNDSLYKTQDGGNTWSNVAFFSSIQNLNSVYFQNSNIGWVVGNNGALLKSIDGGILWLPIHTYSADSLIK